MEVLPDDIAQLVLRTFDGLEKKRKPFIRADGVKEWVPLSGIVAQSSYRINGNVRCFAEFTS